MQTAMKWLNRPVAAVILGGLLAAPVTAEDGAGNNGQAENDDPIRRMQSIGDDTLRRYEGRSRENAGDRVRDRQTNIRLRDLEVPEHETRRAPREHDEE